MCMYSSEFKESDKKYYHLVNSILDVIIELNLNLKITYINPQVNDVLGYSPEELLGKRTSDFIHPDDIPKATQAFKRTKNSKLIISEEVRLKHKQGYYKSVSVRGGLIENNNPTRIIAVLRDITEKKEAEQRLKESEEKYREAYNRAELYKDLFYHDINNICSNIKFSIDLSEIYLHKPGKEREIKDLYKLIRDQFKKSQKLISNVKKLSNLENSKISLKSINASKTLDEAIQFIKNSLQTKIINFNIELFENEVLVLANELLLDIFDNILINAVNYNDNIQIEILIKISRVYKQGKKKIKFEFIDNGIGIPDQKKGIIFQERFCKEKGSKGMGFGLTLVKKIIESYSGEIWVEDRVRGDYSKGSNFVIVIPEFVK